MGGSLPISSSTRVLGNRPCSSLHSPLSQPSGTSSLRWMRMTEPVANSSRSGSCTECDCVAMQYDPCSFRCSMYAYAVALTSVPCVSKPTTLLPKSVSLTLDVVAVNCVRRAYSILLTSCRRPFRYLNRTMPVTLTSMNSWSSAAPYGRPSVCRTANVCPKYSGHDSASTIIRRKAVSACESSTRKRSYVNVKSAIHVLVSLSVATCGARTHSSDLESKLSVWICSRAPPLPRNHSTATLSASSIETSTAPANTSLLIWSATKRLISSTSRRWSGASVWRRKISTHFATFSSSRLIVSITWALLATTRSLTVIPQPSSIGRPLNGASTSVSSSPSTRGSSASVVGPGSTSTMTAPRAAAASYSSEHGGRLRAPVCLTRRMRRWQCDAKPSGPRLTMYTSR
eukprot:Unigene6822_Nuclearia_a/m.20910 Unigene6822_Nuclearia_a/g.20910  ORF Unigene6822_Nuclearia_a/g.20910 Unigene6822_Nuclearia_a/m.20910 type:complete len:400 (+) Unigene6822_Nuclearia_a:1888-3087(+)